MHLRHIPWRQFHTIFFIICAACLLTATCCRRSSMEFSTCGILSAIIAEALWMLFLHSKDVQTLQIWNNFWKGKTLQKARKLEHEGSVWEKVKRGDLLRYKGQFGVMLLQCRMLRVKGYSAIGNNMANTVQCWHQRDHNCWWWENIKMYQLTSETSLYLSQQMVLFWIKCGLSRPGNVAICLS